MEQGLFQYIYNNNMNQIDINQQDLAHILQLLQLAQSSDNNNQHQVYQTLREIQTHPISYLYLALIFNDPSPSLPIRKLAALTLNSALKRNISILDFPPHQLDQLTQTILRQQNPQLQTTKYTLISSLITVTNFNYSLFTSLVIHLPSNIDNIFIINFILEDIKGNIQNDNVFGDSRFISSMKSLYEQILGMFIQVSKQQLKNNNKILEFMKCLNALTFHCPSDLHNLLEQYLINIVQPIIVLSIKEDIGMPLALLALESYNEVVSTKPYLAIRLTQMTQLVLNYKYFHGNSVEMNKSWTNIVIQIIENDQNDSMKFKLMVIIPKTLENLTFSQQDKQNIKQEMQVQYNPYSEESKTCQDEEEEQDLTEKGFSGDTLRRLSFILARKIAINYSEGLWQQFGLLVSQKMTSVNYSEVQTAVSFIGIISQTCIEALAPQLENILTFLIKFSQHSPSYLVRASSLWTLEKLLPYYHENTQFVLLSIGIIHENFVSQHQQVSTPMMMNYQAGISFIDTVLEQDNSKIMLEQNIASLQQISTILIQGLNIITGRLLISVFKAISTIFELNLPQSPTNLQILSNFIQNLNKKWQAHPNRDSVVCPILECLITGYQTNHTLFQPYTSSYLQILIPMLNQSNRTSMVLRCIDFLSSIVNKGEVNPMINSESFLQMVYQLIFSQEKQIVHFTYGLISDLSKKYDLTCCVEKFVQAVAQTIQDGIMTSLSNGLTCLTDLLTAYYQVTSAYLSEILNKTFMLIKSKRMEPIISFNISRIYGRLSLLNPQLSKSYILSDPRTVKAIFLSLRVRQVTKITSDGFKGLLLTLSALSQQELMTVTEYLQCVIDALICYPVSMDQSPQSQQLLVMFIHFVKQLRGKLGEVQWNRITNLPLFLPGSLKTLNGWLTCQ